MIQPHGRASIRSRGRTVGSSGDSDGHRTGRCPRRPIRSLPSPFMNADKTLVVNIGYSIVCRPAHVVVFGRGCRYFSEARADQEIRRIVLDLVAVEKREVRVRDEDTDARPPRINTDRSRPRRVHRDSSRLPITRCARLRRRRRTRQPSPGPAPYRRQRWRRRRRSHRPRRRRQRRPRGSQRRSHARCHRSE